MGSHARGHPCYEWTQGCISPHAAAAGSVLGPAPPAVESPPAGLRSGSPSQLQQGKKSRASLITTERERADCRDEKKLYRGHNRARTRAARTAARTSRELPARLRPRSCWARSAARRPRASARSRRASTRVARITRSRSSIVKLCWVAVRFHIAVFASARVTGLPMCISAADPCSARAFVISARLDARRL